MISARKCLREASTNLFLYPNTANNLACTYFGNPKVVNTLKKIDYLAIWEAKKSKKKNKKRVPLFPGEICSKKESNKACLRKN